MRSIGIIRGERPTLLSPGLLLAIELHMELIFIRRTAYQLKEVPSVLHDRPYYLIPEGGYGYLGMEGAKDILGQDTREYTHIITSVGTGTTVAGLVEASANDQCVLGISSLKNNTSLEASINHLISAGNKDRFIMNHDFHFGGYAKKTSELIRFMNDWYTMTAIPTDFVYTAKMFYAFKSLCEQDFFSPGSHILLIHTGGLQGNLSLPKGTLIF
jgi:1-aminocyclopropane-1-carboxylate deaminase